MKSPLTIYRASAGSGKTFTLTAEYVALLLATPSDHEAEHILAVTFTNKATAEMKDRILSSLYTLGNDLDGDQGMLRKVQECLAGQGISLEPGELRKRAKKALSAILHDYSHFRVETIDSFFQSILRTLAHELGLASGLRVELNSNQVVARAVDSVMEHLSERPDVRQWVLDYVREQIENSDRWDIRGSMNSLGRCIYEEEYQSHKEQQKVTSEEEQEKAISFKRTLNALRTKTEESIRQEASLLLEHINGQVADFDRISYGRSSFEPFLLQASKMGTAEGRSMTYKLPSARITDAADNPEKLLKAADRKKPELMAEATETAGMLSLFCSHYAQALYILASIKLSLHYLPPLRLLGTIEEEATEISAEAGQFLLSRTAALLSRMVEGSDAPFVLERAGVQFRHIMIDEFQDTSRLQWSNFRSLLLENIATGGHSLLVGDVKQSIYRWRGGDWEILHGAQHDLKHLAPQQTTLRDNWRSLPQVIDFNNAFFPRAASMLDGQDEEADFKLADIYEDVEQNCAHADGEQGFASVCLYKRQGKKRPEGYEENMVREMADAIRQLKSKGVHEQQMAILVRRNRTASQLLTLFHRLAPDIQLVSDEAFLLQASVSVQMLVAAMQLTADGMQKADPVVLRYLMLHYQQDILGLDIPLHQVMHQQPEDVLPPELTSHREQMARLPLLLLAERLYYVLQLERIKGQDAYVLAFMDELQSYLRDNPQDIHQFLQAWNDNLSTRPIPGCETGGIRILTIHKSKGLEYHTVFLPFMDWNLGIDPLLDSLLWCNAAQPPFDQMGTLPIRLSAQMENSVFSSDYRHEMLQRRVDTLNMIYVAFTRARCNLMIWGMTTANDKLACVGDLIFNALEMVEEDDILRFQQGSLCGAGEEKKPRSKEDDEREKRAKRMNMPCDETNAVEICMSTRPPTMQFMQSEQARLFMHSLGDDTAEELQTDSYIETGKLMHYALSQIKCIHDAPAVLDHMEEEGLAEQSEAWKKARRCIERGLANPTVAQWFAPGKRFLRECGIITRDPATGQAKVRRPDRVVMEPGLITVVDYKFGKRKRDYEDQVRDYMKLVGEMYPGTKVEGWLWYVYSGQTDRVLPE